MRYTAIAIVTLPAGAVLGLSESQAATRKHALEPGKKKGFYTSTATVQFKVGESFHYDGDLPKGLADSLESEESARQVAKSRAEADAKVQALDQAKSALDAATAAYAAITDQTPAEEAYNLKVDLDQATTALAKLQG